MKQLDVVTFGEAMAMFIAEQVGELHQVEHFTRSLAGAETNVAIGLSRLGYQVGWISKVGDDPFGRFVREALQREGVDTSQVQTDSRYPTGFQLKSKVQTGDPQVQYFRKGSAASTLAATDIVASYLTSARHLHLTGIPLALSSTCRDFAIQSLAIMKQVKRSVSFDPNLRPTLWSSTTDMVDTINAVAVQTDVVMPGIAEGKILTGFDNPRDIAGFYLDKGVKLVVVKLGPTGAYYRTAKEEQTVAGFQVDHVVDTVGAGDGFAVGVISGLLDSLTLAEAVKRGNAIGALAVMSPGDMDGLPTRSALDLFIQNGQRSA